LGMGAGRNIRPAVWAEVYGTRNLGAIRSLESTFVVFAASLSPGITGWILDRGMKIDHLLFIAVATIAAVSALSAMAPKPKSEKPGD
ncbi:MAG: MFS transporter, partial [Nitrospinota bacterium]|nr:MFS transporter [Nitrospinota bacterium]